MRRTIFVQKVSPPPPTEAATVVESTVPTPTVKVEQIITASSTLGDFKKHMRDLVISMLAVMIMAALQAGLTYMEQLFPDASVGMSQLGAAFAAVKFLGR